MIDITGKDKGAVLAALFNHAKPQGPWIRPMDHELELEPGEAGEYLKRVNFKVDYLMRRPIKINFEGDTIDVRLYDRDRGKGEALKALQEAGLHD